MWAWKGLDPRNREYLIFIHRLLTILLVLLFLITGYILIINIERHSKFEDYASHLSFPILAAGVLSALIATTYSIIHSCSKEYMLRAESLLEQAYNVIAVLNEKGWPKSDRLNWLTAARLILSSQELSKNVSIRNHKRILQDAELLWRTKFFDLLQMDKGSFPADYFAENPKNAIIWDESIRPPISRRSLAVVYRFVKWPETVGDPIKEVPDFSEEEIEKMTIFGPEGLGSHLKGVADFLKLKSKKPGDV